MREARSRAPVPVAQHRARPGRLSSSRAVGAAGARLPDTEKVTGSNPVRPTSLEREIEYLEQALGAIPGAKWSEWGQSERGQAAAVPSHGSWPRSHTIVDRVKELIKYKGLQVAPAELEAILMTHPQVADCTVSGVPGEEAGEVRKAFVVSAGDDFDGNAGPRLRRREGSAVQAHPAHRARAGGPQVAIGKGSSDACSALLSAAADRPGGKRLDPDASRRVAPFGPTWSPPRKNAKVPAR